MRTLYLFIIGVFCLGGCSGEWSDYPMQPLQIVQENHYINVNDVVSVSVFNEPDLSGDYNVLMDGTIQMPLIGFVDIQNLTAAQATTKIENEFKIQKYLVNPKINVSVTQLNTVKILGEVLNAGEYDFKRGMTVLGVVAKAGGFSYRANQIQFDIIRVNIDGTTKRIRGVVSTYVQPGDIIRVSQRYF